MFTVTPRAVRRSTTYLHTLSIIVVAAIAVVIPTIVRSQDATGIVTGTVTDQNQRPLAGAFLSVVDGKAEVSAGREGRYSMPNVAAGTRRIVVRYLGYQPETLSVNVNVVARGTVRADVSLKRPLQQLDAIIVESAVAGQAAALNQQRAADNLSNVVDAELVGRLPDRNLAEALGRVPGIALVRDQGEGRFVQIRGTNAALSTLSIDGMRMANPSPASRQTPMDVIPSDMVAAIQVSKTLTPEMEGDAIGGNVNLVTPAPRSGPVQMSINLAGGQNLINKGLLGNASGTVGGRFGPQNKFGVLVGANFYQNDRGSQNYEMGWCVETTCNGVPASNALDVPASLALRDYSQILRRRHGANAAVDYQFNDRHQLFAKYFWSNFCDDEQRYVTTSNFSAGTYSNIQGNTGTVTNGRMDKELRLRPVCQEQQSVQAGGKHGFSSGTDVDYTVQVAKAMEDRPNSLTMVFRQSGINFGYDVTDKNRPIANALSGAPLDATKFNYNSLRRQTRDANEDENTGRLNIAQAFQFGSLRGSLKIGGLVRDKDRSSVDSSTRFLTTYKTGAPTPTLPVTIAAVAGTPRTYNFLDSKFVFGPQAGARPVRDFYEAYKNALSIDTAASKYETTQGSFDISERVAAGYGMVTVDIGQLRLLGGARGKSGPAEGYIWQYRLTVDAKGVVSGTKVRAFGAYSGKKEIESIAVDDSLGFVYYSDEGVGVRQYYADPDSSNKELALFATTGVVEDHEGLAIYPTGKSTGYIILSDQGANRIHVFAREGTAANPFEHRRLAVIPVRAQQTDGLEVSEHAFGAAYPKGMLVMMSNRGAFHYYDWRDVEAAISKAGTK